MQLDKPQIYYFLLEEGPIGHYASVLFCTVRKYKCPTGSQFGVSGNFRNKV